MYSVLVIQNKNISTSSLKDSLESFEDIDVTNVDTLEKALELFEKRYFEIVFIDSDFNALEQIPKFYSQNNELIIICVYDTYDENRRKKAIESGIKDCIHKEIDTDLLKQRISNYIELVQLNKERLFHSNAINLFDEDIYQRFLTFKLNSSRAKLEFWDYFSDTYFEKYENISESLDILYAFASWMFLNKRDCELVKETSPESMYLTLQPIDYMNKKVMNDIIEKYAHLVNYRIENHKLSLKVDIKIGAPKNSNISKLDETTKDILGKTHFEKITAYEYVNSTALEFINKIEDLSELEDKIDEALIKFEENPNTQTIQLLSEKILEYVDVLELLVDFSHLAYGLKRLADALKGITEEQMQEKEVKKFTTLALHLLNDLSTWRDNIFIKQEANDIHYLDSSLLSSCLQIEAVFQKEKIEEDEDDFELF